MTDLINKLKITISEESQKQILCGDKFIKIKEDKSSAKLKAVTIDKFHKNDHIFGFSLDLERFKQLSLYVNRKNYNKGCDGIIVVVRNNHVYFLICELKSNNPKQKDYLNQINNSEAFICYLIKALNYFDNIDIKKENLSIIRLLFDTQNINKAILRPNDNKPKLIKGNIYKIDCFEGDSSTFPIKYFLDSCNT
ncbi:MAG: hypothetical protein NT007_00485 [Candidatus Kapabacteria bacterium]|nr:hypothetical protein [Candidatus Kapabacteria bacterium]